MFQGTNIFMQPVFADSVASLGLQAVCFRNAMAMEVKSGAWNLFSTSIFRGERPLGKLRTKVHGPSCGPMHGHRTFFFAALNHKSGGVEGLTKNPGSKLQTCKLIRTQMLLRTCFQALLLYFCCAAFSPQG